MRIQQHPVWRHVLRRTLVVRVGRPGCHAAECGSAYDAAALRASLDKLTHVKVGTGTASQIRADLNDAEANLTALVNHARGQWQAETSALDSTLTTLKTAVSNLASNPSACTVSGVVTALGGVDTAARNLLAVVNTSRSLRFLITQHASIPPGAAFPRVLPPGEDRRRPLLRLTPPWRGDQEVLTPDLKPGQVRAMKTANPGRAAK